MTVNDVNSIPVGALEVKEKRTAAMATIATARVM
jgi:hypothetical protein